MALYGVERYVQLVGYFTERAIAGEIAEDLLLADGKVSCHIASLLRDVGKSGLLGLSYYPLKVVVR